MAATARQQAASPRASFHTLFEVRVTMGHIVARAAGPQRDALQPLLSMHGATLGPGS